MVPSRGLASAGGGGTRSIESGEGGPDENDSGGAGSGATVPSFLRFLYSAASESTASRYQKIARTDKRERERERELGRCVGLPATRTGRLGWLSSQ